VSSETRSPLAPIPEAWTATLALDLHPVPAAEGYRPEVSSFVQITGEWRGLLVVSGSERMARNIAAAKLDSDMVNDAFGEMANVLGGVVKLGLPGSEGLSLPMVVQGYGHLVSLPLMKMVESQYYECDGELLSVKLCHHVGSGRVKTIPMPGREAA
jgi:hypothetical protein